MKNVLKIGFLMLLATQLMVGCGNSDKNKTDGADSTGVKDVKKGDKVDPTAGCD